jgi:hypothetical protein
VGPSLAAGVIGPRKWPKHMVCFMVWPPRNLNASGLTETGFEPRKFSPVVTPSATLGVEKAQQREVLPIQNRTWRPCGASAAPPLQFKFAVLGDMPRQPPPAAASPAFHLKQAQHTRCRHSNTSNSRLRLSFCNNPPKKLLSPRRPAANPPTSNSMSSAAAAAAAAPEPPGKRVAVRVCLGLQRMRAGGVTVCGSRAAVQRSCATWRSCAR